MFSKTENFNKLAFVHSSSLHNLHNLEDTYLSPSDLNEYNEQNIPVRYSSNNIPVMDFCPIGLESLLEVGQMVIHMGHLRHDIIFNVRSLQRMEAIDEMRRVLFYIEQEKSFVYSNSMLFKVYNNNKQEAMHLFIPSYYSYTSCCINFKWFQKFNYQAVVYAPLGYIVGFVRHKRTYFVQEFEVLDPQENIILRLRGNPYDFKIWTEKLDLAIGRLSTHNWVGVMHEIRRTANDIGITFPVDLDVKYKCLLLAASFVIELYYSRVKMQ